MTKFEEQVEVALLNSLGLLNSLRDRDQLSMVPESEWASITAKKIAGQFKGDYVPFVSEVEEFNATMGKPNNYEPIIPEKKEWMFVYDFILEELESTNTLVKQGTLLKFLMLYVTLPTSRLVTELCYMVLRISYGTPIKKYKRRICQRLVLTKKKHNKQWIDVPLSKKNRVTTKRLVTIILSIEHVTKK